MLLNFKCNIQNNLLSSCIIRLIGKTYFHQINFLFSFGKMRGLYRSSGRERDAIASKVFWSQKTAGGNSDELPPAA